MVLGRKDGGDSGSNRFEGLAIIASMESFGNGAEPDRFDQSVNEFLDGLLASDLGDTLIEAFEVICSSLVVLVEGAGLDVDARVLGEKLLLFRGAFVDQRIESRTQLHADRFVEFVELGLAGLREVAIKECLSLDGHSLSLGFNLVCLLTILFGVEGDQTRLGRLPVLPIERGFEDGAKRIVVSLQNGIVAMVVTLSTSDGEAKQRCGDDLDGVGNDLVSGFW